MDNENILLTKSIEELQEDISRLKAELAEREAALPAHSVRPHQLMTIEELEEEISMKEEVLNAMEKEGKGN
jgi:ribosomal protein L29